jgi:hypothetical protein
MKRGKTSPVPESRRWTVGTARGVLEALEQSGLPATRFAARHGMGVERLYWWRRRLGRGKTLSSRPPRFTEVHLAVPAPAAIEVVLADGVTLRFAGASRLDDAVAVLGRLAAR